MSPITRLPDRRGEPGVDPGPYVPPGEIEGLDARRLLGGLRRRKVLIGGIVFLGTALALLLVNQITPLYLATSQVVVESNRQNVVNIEQVSQAPTPDYYTNETQAAVIASRALAVQAVDKLDLYNNPSFNPELAQERARRGPVATVRGWITGKGTEPAVSPWAGMAPAEKRAAMREYLAGAYLAGLNVVPSSRSRVIAIEYTSTDPAFAARAANTTAELYLADQLSSKSDATVQATDWLDRRVAELSAKLVESERKVDEYRAKSGIVEAGAGSSIVQEQLTRLNGDLVAARAKRAEAGARYEQIQGMIKDGAGVDTAAAVLDSPLIVQLRSQEATVVRKIAELKTQVRDEHPNMILAQNELKDLQAKIAAEVNKIAVSLGNDYEIAKVRERNLLGEVRNLEAQAQRQNEAEVTLRSLMSEARANKQLYETVLSRYKETKVFDKDLERADARVISRATVPGVPFYPQKSLIVLAAFLVSAVLGVALALILEYLDQGFRSISQLETITGLPVLGATPQLTRRDRRKHPHAVAIARPNSAFGEAVRTIRTGLMLADADNPPRTIMITSAVSGEGKSSLSLSLASLAARSGQRVIVVDADMRHPNLHEMLEQPNGTGLSDVLGGRAPLEEVIKADDHTGIHYITAGSRAPQPADLIGALQMRTLLRTLAGLYDLVVIDTPPLLAVSDALLLVRHVDHSVYVVRWERTRRETAIAGLKQLVDAGAKHAALVLAQVDVGRQARYGYRDSGYYYYGHHSKYYTE
jgi:capsular exopolysaccharide synthesis family protein